MTAITGGRFKLKDTDIFKIPGNPHLLHLASVEYGLREFIVMLHRSTNQVYIEEVVLETKDLARDVWANLKFIEDDSLAEDLAAFAQSTGIIDMKRVTSILAEQGARLWSSGSR